MPKRSFLKQPFASQRLTGSQTLLKHARHHFYTTAPLIWDKLSWKKLFLVKSEILALFGNTLTVNEKYSRHNIENLQQQIQVILSQKRKEISGFFIEFPKFTSNSEYFQKKRWVSELQYFRNYWLRKRWLLKYLKVRSSGTPSAVNVLMGLKHYWNLHGTTFVLLSH